MKNRFSSGIGLVLLMPYLACAAGADGSGGGDAIKQDFLISASAAYQLILKNGATLQPQVDPAKFGAAIDPSHITSTDHELIYQNTVVDAYYDKTTDMILINRLRWQ